jgi:hypothetical protein
VRSSQEVCPSRSPTKEASEKHHGGDQQEDSTDDRAKSVQRLRWGTGLSRFSPKETGHLLLASGLT